MMTTCQGSTCPPPAHLHDGVDLHAGEKLAACGRRYVRCLLWLGVRLCAWAVFIDAVRGVESVSAHRQSQDLDCCRDIVQHAWLTARMAGTLPLF